MIQEKYKTLQIVHMFLMVLAIIQTAITMIDRIMSNGLLSDILLDLSKAGALFCGSIYLIFNYRKDVAGFYKGFIFCTIISFLLRIVVFFTNGQVTPIQAVCSFVSLASLFALEYIKDLGEERTSQIYAVLLVSEILIAIPMFVLGTFDSIVSSLTVLLIIGTLGMMITFKYIDKASRGSK